MICSNCELTFSTKYNYNRHMDTFHFRREGLILLSLSKDIQQVKFTDLIIGKNSQILGKCKLNEIIACLPKGVIYHTNLPEKLLIELIKYQHAYMKNQILNFIELINNEHQCVLANGSFLKIGNIYKSENDKILQETDLLIVRENEIMVPETFRLITAYSDFRVYRRNRSDFWNPLYKITLLVTENIEEDLTALLKICQLPFPIYITNNEKELATVLSYNVISSTIIVKGNIIIPQLFTKNRTLIMCMRQEDVSYELLMKTHYIVTNLVPSLDFYYYFRFSNMGNFMLLTSNFCT